MFVHLLLFLVLVASAMFLGDRTWTVASRKSSLVAVHGHPQRSRGGLQRR